MMRSSYRLAAIPALALASAPFLPFLLTTELWFGLPPMLVWTIGWCLLTTPILLVIDRDISKHERNGISKNSEVETA